MIQGEVRCFRSQTYVTCCMKVFSLSKVFTIRLYSIGPLWNQASDDSGWSQVFRRQTNVTRCMKVFSLSKVFTIGLYSIWVIVKSGHRWFRVKSDFLEVKPMSHAVWRYPVCPRYLPLGCIVCWPSWNQTGDLAGCNQAFGSQTDATGYIKVFSLSKIYHHQAV